MKAEAGRHHETHGYPCGCVYYTVNGLVVEAKFCPRHQVARDVLVEGLA
jgi:hypothetical protein